MSRKNNEKVIPRVFVAMSGGVDSSVAAAILKGRGFVVEGVFMDLGSKSNEAWRDAVRVARVLKIKLHKINLAAAFKRKIVDYFIDEYGHCRTPNPCVRCNREIKFGALWREVKKMGGDYLATGHYVIKTQEQKNTRTKSTNFPPILRKEGGGGGYHLSSAKDKNKDQSYFLYNLTQKELKHLLFPIGDFTKSEVRALAWRFQLPTAERAESQEICFIADNDHNKFLRQYLKPRPGKIVDPRGKVLGEHPGLLFYTIGQRQGVGLAGGPYYVAGFNIRKNQLIVSNKQNDPRLYKKELLVKDVSWVLGEPKMPLKCRARIRYRGDLASATVVKKGKNILVKFTRPVRAVTPGQSVVFYRDVDSRGLAWTDAGGELLGGGIIKI